MKNTGELNTTVGISDCCKSVSELRSKDCRTFRSKVPHINSYHGTRYIAAVSPCRNLQLQKYLQISDIRLGSKRAGARIRTQDHPPPEAVGALTSVLIGSCVEGIEGTPGNLVF